METKNISFFDAFRLATAFTVVGLCLFFLYSIADILWIFLAAFIFAIALDRPLDALVRKGVPRTIATVFIYITFMLMTIALVFYTVPPLVQEIRNFTQSFSEISVAGIPNIAPEIEESATATSEYLSSIRTVFESSSQVVIDTAMRVYSGLLTFVIIFFLALFLNIQRDGVRLFITLLVPVTHQQYASNLFTMVQKRLSSWLWGKTLSSVFVASVIFPGLLIMDIPYAVTFTVLAFFLNYIPFVGPLIAGTVPFLLGFNISPLVGLAVVLLYVTANTIENFLVIPLLLKQSIQLNPVLLLFVVLVCGRYGGVLAILISIPIAAIITLLYEEYLRKWHRASISGVER